MRSRWRRGGPRPTVTTPCCLGRSPTSVRPGAWRHCRVRRTAGSAVSATQTQVREVPLTRSASPGPATRWGPDRQRHPDGGGLMSRGDREAAQQPLRQEQQQHGDRERDSDEKSNEEPPGALVDRAGHVELGRHGYRDGAAVVGAGDVEREVTACHAVGGLFRFEIDLHLRLLAGSKLDASHLADVASTGPPPGPATDDPVKQTLVGPSMLPLRSRTAARTPRPSRAGSSSLVGLSDGKSGRKCDRGGVAESERT